MFFNKQKKAQGMSVPLMVVGAMAGLVVGILVLLLLTNVLRTSGILPAGAEANAFTSVAQNVSVGVTNFSGYVPTVFIVGAVVMILGIIGLLYFFFRNR